MKRLSLSILLLLFGASNVQAVSLNPLRLIKPTFKWVNDNKKKAFVAGCGAGIAAATMYVAHKERVNYSTALRILFAETMRAIRPIVKELCPPKVPEFGIRIEIGTPSRGIFG